VNCRFYLFDIDETSWEGKPGIRLWGIDDRGRRVVVVSTHVQPYFYFLPHADPGSTLATLHAEKQRFPNVVTASLLKRRLLGKENTVLRIECSQPSSVAAYARQLPKFLHGRSFDDLRLSNRYITDLKLTTSGWNECEAEPITIDRMAAVSSYRAVTPPRGEGGSDPLPKLRYLAFDVLAVGGKGSARPERDPVQALAVATDGGSTTLLMNSGTDDSGILKRFVAMVDEYDPDIIVGYDSNGSSWPYLMRRVKTVGMKLTLGRDGSEPHTSVFGHTSISGRANLDLADIASGIAEIKVKDLKSLARYFRLPVADQLTVTDDWIKPSLWSAAHGQRTLVEETRSNALACLELVRFCIDYPTHLSVVTGLPLDQVMAAAVGFRVDSYFLRTAHGVGELIPTKNELPFITYRGALVLEPETGLHKNIAVLDFASMYPSLMQKYNLSPETLVRPGDEVPPELVYEIPEVGHRFRKQPDGFYRLGLKQLIQERAHIKSELASSPENTTLHRVLREHERAIKVITNACYGYAGWAGARWYVPQVAESAAALGRRLITETIEKAKALGLDVIYGDTDSVFVSNDRQKVGDLMTWVNEDPELEIRVEREYVRILFTEAMKRYAGLRSDGTLDIIGLEAVRGDWSEIAQMVQEEVLRAILERESTELAIESVRQTVRSMRSGEMAMDGFIIRKALTKPIEEYKVRTPHVEVAKKLAKEGWEIAVGEKVPYVIAKEKGALFQKARPYTDAKPQELDIDYYVDNQVKPAAMRVLEVFGVTEKQAGF